jgi:hypothetical protein
VGAVTGDNVGKVLLVSERQAGQVVQGIALEAPDQSITPVISSPSTNTWVICRSPCVNTGVHGRSAASAIWRLRVTISAGRTPFVTSHSHSPSRRDAISSRL